MLKKTLSRSRYLVIFAVFGCLILATLLFVYSLIQSVSLVLATIDGRISGKKMAVEAIGYVDLFLLATVVYIVALGLYELFVDDSLVVPDWLVIRTLDDLKAKLLGVVVTVLGVLFLGQIVVWDGVRDLQGYGVAVALVIGAITFYTRQK
jgi:uncharacterized membrane protein YqhA